MADFCHWAQLCAFLSSPPPHLNFFLSFFNFRLSYSTKYTILSKKKAFYACAFFSIAFSLQKCTYLQFLIMNLPSAVLQKSLYKSCGELSLFYQSKLNSTQSNVMKKYKRFINSKLPSRPPNRPNPAPNHPKSQFLFHENSSSRDFIYNDFGFFQEAEIAEKKLWENA